LILSIERAIAIIHNSTSLALTVFKRMRAIEVVTQLMRKCEPWRTSVYLVDASVVAFAANGAHPSKSSNTILRTTCCEAVNGALVWKGALGDSICQEFQFLVHRFEVIALTTWREF